VAGRTFSRRESLRDEPIERKSTSFTYVTSKREGREESWRADVNAAWSFTMACCELTRSFCFRSRPVDFFMNILCHIITSEYYSMGSQNTVMFDYKYLLVSRPFGTENKEEEEVGQGGEKRKLC
jgi:hypothetical protein